MDASLPPRAASASNLGLHVRVGGVRVLITCLALVKGSACLVGLGMDTAAAM
jgi:hypothetical protein